MKRKFIITIIFMIVIPMTLISCNGGTDAITTQAEDTTEAPVQDIDLSEYKIIRPDAGDQTEVDAALLLRNIIKETVSKELSIGSDWIQNGTTHDDDAKEILIGYTNYSQTAAIYEGLSQKDYSIVISGNKIVIVGGSPSATYSAVEYFCENYISYENGNPILKSEESYFMKYDYLYDELDIKVVSLNVLTASNTQKNQQAEREPRIVEFVNSYQPYSIGVQECEIFWRMRLDKVLTGYDRAQEITTVTKNYIYYRTDKLKVVDSGVFWLSETPDESSKGFGSIFYISCCWAIFESLENGSRYVHMNTHLDVNSKVTRESELTVLLPKVQEFINQGYAVVLTGDFNSNEDSVVYETVTGIGLGSSRYLTSDTSNLGTFNGLKTDTANYNGPIDYCFVNDEISVTKYSVIDKFAGGFLSDHNALYIEMTIYPR